MKRSEIEALREAFDLPEPCHKDAFIAEFQEKEQLKEKPPFLTMSRIFRISTIAAMAAIAIGVTSHFALNRDFFHRFTPDDTIDSPAVTTVTDTAYTSPTAAVTTVQAENTCTTAVPVTETSPQETGTQPTEQETAPADENDAPTEPPRTTIAAVTAEKTVTTVRSTSTIPPASTSKTTASSQTTTKKTIAAPVSSTVTTQAENSTRPTKPPASGDNPGGGTQVSPGGLVYYPPEPYYLDRSATIRELQAGGDNNPAVSPGEDMTLSRLYDRSDIVVKGYVIDTVYTAFDRDIVTIRQIMVTEVYKGSARPFNRFSVCFSGGYFPADRYCQINGMYNHFGEGTVLHTDCGNSDEFPDVECLFFLSIDFDSYPDTMLVPATGRESAVFKPVDLDGKYRSLGSSMTFYEQDLRNIAGI